MIHMLLMVFEYNDYCVTNHTEVRTYIWCVVQ